MKKIFFSLAFFSFCLFTFDLFGQSITWQRFYRSGGVDIAYSIQQTPDNGYISTGRYASQIYVMKLSQNGDSIWFKLFPGGWAEDIKKTNDGNYIIAGNFGSLIKINDSGDTLWTNPPNYFDRFESINQTFDKGYIVCGSRDEMNRYIPLLQKYDSLGNLLWSKVYTNGIIDGNINDMLITSNGYILAGHYNDSNLIDRFFLMKTDFSGNQTFFINYDTIGLPSKIISTSDNGYIIGGSGPPGISAFLAKFDENCNLIWRKIYDTGTKLGTCNYLTTTFEGGYAITGEWDTAGTFDKYIRLIKTDSLGVEQWRKVYGYVDDHASFCVQQTTDSGFVIGGYIGVSFDDLYYIKTDRTGYANPPIGVHKISNEVPTKIKVEQNYPNPFNSTTKIRYQIKRQANISIKIYNILGQEIKILLEKIQRPGNYLLVFNANNLSSGFYFYTLLVNGLVSDTKKMLLLK